MKIDWLIFSIPNSYLRISYAYSKNKQVLIVKLEDDSNGIFLGYENNRLIIKDKIDNFILIGLAESFLQDN